MKRTFSNQNMEAMQDSLSKKNMIINGIQIATAGIVLLVIGTSIYANS